MLLAGAEFGLLRYGMMDLGWWSAHALEVAGIGLVGIPAALDLRHATASRPPWATCAEHVVADEETFLGGRVHALLRRLALTRDGVDRGVTPLPRVATLAVQIGEQLGLPAHRLRLLALGGLLHDMGKLIPDEILNKPGKLTDAEFDVIKGHPRPAASCSPRSAVSRRSCSTSSRATTSASTAAAYPNHAVARQLEVECASSRSPTSTTR